MISRVIAFIFLIAISNTASAAPKKLTCYLWSTAEAEQKFGYTGGLEKGAVRKYEIIFDTSHFDSLNRATTFNDTRYTVQTEESKREHPNKQDKPMERFSWVYDFRLTPTHFGVDRGDFKHLNIAINRQTLMIESKSPSGLEVREPCAIEDITETVDNVF